MISQVRSDVCIGWEAEHSETFQRLRRTAGGPMPVAASRSVSKARQQARRRRPVNRDFAGLHRRRIAKIVVPEPHGLALAGFLVAAPVFSSLRRRV